MSEKLFSFCRHGIQKEFFLLCGKGSVPNDPGKDNKVVHFPQYVLVTLDFRMEFLIVGSDQKSKHLHPVTIMFNSNSQQMLSLVISGLTGIGEQLQHV